MKSPTLETLLEVLNEVKGNALWDIVKLVLSVLLIWIPVRIFRLIRKRMDGLDDVDSMRERIKHWTPELLQELPMEVQEKIQKVRKAVEEHDIKTQHVFRKYRIFYLSLGGMLVPIFPFILILPNSGLATMIGCWILHLVLVTVACSVTLWDVPFMKSLRPPGTVDPKPYTLSIALKMTALILVTMATFELLLFFLIFHYFPIS